MDREHIDAEDQAQAEADRVAKAGAEGQAEEETEKKEENGAKQSPRAALGLLQGAGGAHCHLMLAHRDEREAFLLPHMPPTADGGSPRWPYTLIRWHQDAH